MSAGNGLTEYAAGEDSQGEQDLAPAIAAVKETTSENSADRIGPEVIKPFKNVRVDEGKAKVLSQRG